ncbi:hypothetical protein WT27_13650 [Burkholderia territorii]|uniref:Uncharacterized protein n=2 Tax=Burkholderia territorii TaxID=1503055 RepID=A0A125BPP2_9BURK|nr:hypothetical protein WT27_13650 [Burkholderia territorii]KVX33910.1 hypothetical protein WT31_09560 [Burkholderia territorii]
MTSKATNKAAEASQEMAYAAYLASFTAEEKLYVVAAAQSWQQDKRGTGFFQSVELNSFEDVIRSLGRGLVHDFILKAQEEAAERSNWKLFEVTAYGFDPRNYKSDDRVFWIRAASEESVKEGIRGTGALFHGEIDSSSDVDFRLPDDLKSMRDRLTAVRVEMPEIGRGSVNWKEIADELYGAVDSLETQVHQMMGMFPDDDGQIQKALDEAGDATSAYRTAKHAGLAPTGKLPKKRIMAAFQPQAWVNDHAMDIDHRTDVDVTDKVLSLPLDTIHRLADDDYDTDDLVDLQALGHNGPFYVEVSKQVCEFFGVAELSDVTEDMLVSARQATVKTPQYQDEEVIGFDKDGRVMQWDGERGLAYNSGESLDEFGLHNLREHELTRVNVTRDTWLAAVSAHAAKHVVTVEVAVPALDAKFASEPTYTAGMRVARMEQAVKAWNVADESDAVCARPDEHALVCILADLRHYCDAHGMDFSQMDRHAYADYLEQRENDRHHGSVSHTQTPRM